MFCFFLSKWRGLVIVWCFNIVVIIWLLGCKIFVNVRFKEVVVLFVNVIWVVLGVWKKFVNNWCVFKRGSFFLSKGVFFL